MEDSIQCVIVRAGRWPPVGFRLDGIRGDSMTGIYGTTDFHSAAVTGTAAAAYEQATAPLAPPPRRDRGVPRRLPLEDPGLVQAPLWRPGGRPSPPERHRESGQLRRGSSKSMTTAPLLPSFVPNGPGRLPAGKAPRLRRLSAPTRRETLTRWYQDTCQSSA